MFLLIFFFSIVFTFIKKEYALFVWMATELMIPSFVRIYPVPVSYELAFCFVCFCFSVYLYISRTHEKYLSICSRWTIIFPLYYVVIRLVFAFLATYFSPSDILVLSYFNLLFLSVSIFSAWMITDKNAGNSNRFISVLLIVVCIYGMITYLLQSNPYLSFLVKFTGDTKDYVGIAAKYASEVRGGLLSRISVLRYNPLHYAILLNIFIYIPIYMYLKERKNIYLITTIFVFINIFLTGSRGPLISLSVSLIFFFIKYQSFTSRVKYIIMAFIGFFLIMLLPGMDSFASYIKSFIFIFDERASDAANITGSSVSGRFLQLSGVISMIGCMDWNTFLFGYGDGYTYYYNANYGMGTDVMGFESILFSSLVNYGVAGFFLIDIVPWLFLFYCIRYLKREKMISKKNLYVLYSMLLTNVLYSFLVGTICYVIYVSIFFCLIKQMIMEKRFNLMNVFLMNVRLNKKIQN